MDWNSLGLPDDIRRTCERITKECEIRKRKNYRLELQAWIIYHAYLEHDIHKDLASVGKIVGIPVSKLINIIRKYSKIIKNYDSIVVVAPAVSIIESVCKTLKLIDYKRPRDILNDILPLMEGKKYHPKDLCLASIMLYLEENNVEWNPDYCDLVNRKPIDVKRVYNIVKREMNK